MNDKFFSIAALIGLMALTRFHHFGSALSLPDASLAVFFLAGLIASGAWFLGALLLEAGIIDYFAIHQFSVSDYCISPAYFFLIPAYSALWFAGRYAKPYLSLNFSGSVKVFALAAISSTIAFAISNSSFYWFSGRFEGMAWLDYIGKTGQYCLPYVSSTMIYTLAGLALVKLWRLVHNATSLEINQ